MNPDVILVSLYVTACGKKIAVASLNSPHTLNALTLEMVNKLHNQLDAWASDDSIVAVIITGEGERALCAGGDIKNLRQLALDGDQGRDFFAREYALDYAIHSYSKPLIVWGKGIVMGGGLGLLAEAPYRVATHSTRIAMPEITIGLYPDVGGSYFLARAPENYGLFMGLTGCSINGADALAIGMVDFLVEDQHYETLLDELCATHWVNDANVIVSNILDNLSDNAADLSPVMTPHRALINELCDGDDLAVICDRLIAVESNEGFIASAQKKFSQGCPMTAHLVWGQIQRAKSLTLFEVFEMEWVMSVNCLSHKDFPEGVRALVIDKDQCPVWQHRTIRDVPAALVETYFELDELNQFSAMSSDLKSVK